MDKEQKRHDKAIEDLQRAQIEWAKKRQKRLDYINNEVMKNIRPKKDLWILIQQCNSIS